MGLNKQYDRLISQHSTCKDLLGNEIEIWQKWRIRSYVAEMMLDYLNSIHPFWYKEDLRKEIKINTDRLVEKWKRGERWLEGDGHER